MDIVFIVLLFVVALVFTVIAWLPKFGYINQMFFSVTSMGGWFIMALLLFNVTTVSPQPYTNSSALTNYPLNNITLQYPNNNTVTYDSAGWIEYTYTDSWLLSGFFVVIGLTMFMRFAFLTMAFLREVGEGRNIKI